MRRPLFSSFAVGGYEKRDAKGLSFRVMTGAWGAGKSEFFSRLARDIDIARKQKDAEDEPGERVLVLTLNELALDAASLEAIQTFLSRVDTVTAKLPAARQEAAIAKLAEVILPDPLADARGVLALDDLHLRDRYLAEESVLTSAQVAEQSGSGSRNPYATAARWKKAGKVFSISHRGSEYFPAFQFRDGRPHPAIAPVLAALPASMSPWQTAYWFASANGWLDEDAPMDRLADVEAVVAAARREGEEVMG